MAVPSFPEVHVTGPVHHFVQVYNAPQPQIMYLGTAEVTPQVQIAEYTQRVMTDQTGKTLPYQETDDGQDATISVVFTRWSKTALRNILSAGYTAERRFFGGGTETRWSRGGLVFGVRTFRLWQVFPNWLDPSITPGMEPGWYWPQVKLTNNDRLAMGSGAEKPLLVFHAQPALFGIGTGPRAAPKRMVSTGIAEPEVEEVPTEDGATSVSDELLREGARTDTDVITPPAVEVPRLQLPPPPSPSANAPNGHAWRSPGAKSLYSNDPRVFPPEVWTFQ